MNLRNLLLAVLAAAVFVFAACGDDDESEPLPTPNPSAAFPVTIADDNGAHVTLDQEPERIVALAPSFVEVLFALDAGEAIVAADENTDYPPEAASIPKISGFQPSVEGITSYEPDLVLLTYDPGGLVDALSSLEIDSLFLASPASIDGAMEQIMTLGQATGRSSEAEELVDGMKADIHSIAAAVPAEGAPRVYHEVDNTYYSAGPGSFIHDLYATLGATNIAEATGEAFPQLSAEAIIQADPEVIILADEFAGESPETVAARPGWDQISAVKNARVHIVDPNIVSRPGPRLVDALATLALLLYPELF
ncbi:MAG TPA: ABC transporter substrate-binding protein [Dehalococcoidia bacterium]|nr:ABC transporter substrate-binding protein [Dehalococcoidia bacterium]